MVYRKGASATFYVRVIDGIGVRRICSTGTSRKLSAVAVEAWVTSVRSRHDPSRVLDAIVAKEVTLVVAYRLGERDTRAMLDARAADARDIDVRPLLTEWLAWRAQRTKGHTVMTRYAAQLGVLFPEAQWKRSLFTVPEFTRRLDAVPSVSDPTRNRYRAALSAFCRYLVRTGVLTHNAARDTDPYEERAARVVWYKEADAMRLVHAIPAPYRVREALMASTGMDWSDCARVRADDIDLDARTVRCHGSKTAHRNRVVRITEAWALPILRDALRGLLPHVVVCRGNPKSALRIHKAEARALGLAVTTLHQWRHHYAVTLLIRGERPQVVAHQEGHGNTKLVLDRYGKFVPRLVDYLPEPRANPATDLATFTIKQA